MKNLLQKKLLPLVLAAALLAGMLISSAPAFAYIPWFEAGITGDKLVSGQYEYQEYTFVTGEPVLLKGYVTIKKPESLLASKPSLKESYSFDLSNEAGDILISRSVTFTIQPTYDEELRQIRIARTMTGYSETITVPDGEYTLGKYNFLESRVMDINAAGGYTSGNAFFERTFYLNGDYMKNSGTLEIKTEVRPIIAYENHYARNESFVVTQKYKRTEPDGKELFGGSVVTGLSSLEKTVFDYQYTDPQSISFRGSFFVYKNEENSMEVKYNFVNEDEKKGSTLRLSSNTVIDSKALNIPQIKDMGGQPSERQVLLLTALGIFDKERLYYVPHAAIPRHEFAKALYITLKGELPEPTKTEVVKRRRPGYETPFVEVNPDDPDYHYIEAYKKEGIVKGRHGYLKPNEPITKAEAITMVMQALGLDKIAPNPPYNTVFADDYAIQDWCRDSFYAALEIGLLGGPDAYALTSYYEEGLYANPNEILSREQAAVLLERVINHLNQRMIEDYREKVIKK